MTKPKSQTHLMLNILLLASLWGPSFLFTKIAMAEIAPLTFVSLRISLAALLLLAVLKFKKIPLPRDPKLWGHCFFMGIVASSLPFTLFGFSLEHIDSSLTALINGTTPIAAILLAHYFLNDEKLTGYRLMGIVLGFSGFMILFLPTLLEGNMAGDGFGMLCSLGASLCYAIGMVYAKKHIKVPEEPIILPTMQLVTSMFYLIPLALLIDPPFNPFAISKASLGCILAIATLGTALAFILYYRIILKYGATALSTVTYVLPLFSILLGVVFLEENISLGFCFAALLILLGTVVANNLLPSFRGIQNKLSKMET